MPEAKRIVKINGQIIELPDTTNDRAPAAKDEDVNSFSKMSQAELYAWIRNWQAGKNKGKGDNGS